MTVKGVLSFIILLFGYLLYSRSKRFLYTAFAKAILPLGLHDLLVVLTEVTDKDRIIFFGLHPIRSYLSGSK